MGVDTLALVLSFTAAALLFLFLGRVVAMLLKIAFVLALAWFFYAKVWPAVKGKVTWPSTNSAATRRI